MTVSLKHTFASAKPDGTDTSLVQPSNWNAEHELTLATNKVLGRATAGTGAAEELSIGTALSISGGTLAVTTVPVANGGTGANTLTGYVKGSGTSAFTASATVPTSDLSGTLAAANGGTGLSSPGASGNILTSNGTAWVSATAGSAVYDLITTVNASGASTVDFTSLSSTYSQYIVVVTNMSVSRVTGAYIDIRVSQNNGSTYDASGYAYSGQTTTSGGVITGTGSASATSINLPLIYSNSPAYSFLTFTVTNAGVSGYLTVQGFGASTTDSCQFLGIRNTVAMVNAIRIFSTSTSPSATLSGTFKLYGTKA